MNRKILLFRRFAARFVVVVAMTAFVGFAKLYAQTNPTDLILKVGTATPVITEGAGAGGKTITVTAINATGAPITGTEITVTVNAGLTVSAAPVSSATDMTVTGSGPYSWSGTMPADEATLTFTLSGTADISAVTDYQIQASVTQLRGSTITDGALALATVRVNPCVTSAVAYVVYDISDTSKTIAITATDGSVSFEKKLSTSGSYDATETGTVATNVMPLPGTISSTAANDAGKIWDIKFTQVDGDGSVCDPVPVCVNTQVEIVDLRPKHPGVDAKTGDPLRPNDAATDPNSPDDPATPADDAGNQAWASDTKKGIICDGEALNTTDLFTVNAVGSGTVSYEWKFNALNGVTYSGGEQSSYVATTTTALDGTFTNNTGAYKDIKIGVKVTYTANGSSVSKEYEITRRVLPAIPAVDALLATLTHNACHGGATGAIDVTTDLTSYDFSWAASNGGDLGSQTGLDLINLKAGTYTLTVTAGSGVCGTGTSVTKDFVIKQPAESSTIPNIVTTTDSNRLDVAVCEGDAASFTLPVVAGEGYKFVDAATGAVADPQPSDWAIAKTATEWTYSKSNVTANERFKLVRLIDVDGDGELDDCGGNLTSSTETKKSVFTVNVVVSDEAIVHNPTNPSGNGAETQTICQGSDINTITYTMANGVVAEVDGTLPAGLTFDGATGVLSGGSALTAGTYTVTIKVKELGKTTDPFGTCTVDADGDGHTAVDIVTIHVLPSDFADYSVTAVAATNDVCEMTLNEVELFNIAQAVPNTPSAVNMIVEWNPHTGTDANLNVQYVKVSDGTITRYGTVDATNGKLTVDVRGMGANAKVSAFVQATKVPADTYNFKVTGVQYGATIDSGSCGTVNPASGAEPSTALNITALPTMN